MPPDRIIDGIQLDTYLKSYNINSGLDIINYKQAYGLNYYIDTVDTNIFYKTENIVASDVNFKTGIAISDKNIILEALNKLRLKCI